MELAMYIQPVRSAVLKTTQTHTGTHSKTALNNQPIADSVRFGGSYRIYSPSVFVPLEYLRKLVAEANKKAMRETGEEIITAENVRNLTFMLLGKKRFPFQSIIYRAYSPTPRHRHEGLYALCILAQKPTYTDEELRKGARWLADYFSNEVTRANVYNGIISGLHNNARWQAEAFANSSSDAERKLIIERVQRETIKRLSGRLTPDDRGKARLYEQAEIALHKEAVHHEAEKALTDFVRPLRANIGWEREKARQAGTLAENPTQQSETLEESRYNEVITILKMFGLGHLDR